MLESTLAVAFGGGPSRSGSRGGRFRWTRAASTPSMLPSVFSSSPARPSDELRVLGGLARHELPAIGRVEHATRLRARQLLFAHRRERAPDVVAGDR